MTVTCPLGHTSETTDFCDRCGGKIDESSLRVVVDLESPHPNGASISERPPASAASAASAAFGDGASPLPARTCPNCHTVDTEGDSFCETCGYHFSTGAVPSVAAAPARNDVWEASAVADRAYYDRLQVDGIAFPAVCPERRYTLSGEHVVIGRRSVSRGTNPQIDLSGAPEDVGVSHTHAVLVHGADGGWAIVDPGSTNGTFLNDGSDPIPTNETVPLREGDQIHIGVWTTLTLRRTS